MKPKRQGRKKKNVTERRYVKLAYASIRETRKGQRNGASRNLGKINFLLFAERRLI